MGLANLSGLGAVCAWFGSKAEICVIVYSRVCFVQAYEVVMTLDFINCAFGECSR